MMNASRSRLIVAIAIAVLFLAAEMAAARGGGGRGGGGGGGGGRGGGSHGGGGISRSGGMSQHSVRNSGGRPSGGNRSYSSANSRFETHQFDSRDSRYNRPSEIGQARPSAGQLPAQRPAYGNRPGDRPNPPGDRPGYGNRPEDRPGSEDREKNREDRQKDRENYWKDQNKGRDNYDDHRDEAYGRAVEWREDRQDFIEDNLYYRGRYLHGVSIFYSVPCTYTVEFVNEYRYYRCGNTWYDQVYYEGAVRYIVITEP
ncbi:MAG: hypothetical protein Q8R92_03905 [Deltaproteobacteria bacterium]|nr:hypothetical protein [Deltaproteobacteria bacterium]